MSAWEAARPLVYVADAHLTRDDPEVDAFLDFLRTVGPTAGTLYILGDLFNVWFGEPRFRMPHQERVLAALGELAGRGVTLKFVEGNRDFSIRRNHLGRPFAAVAEDSLVEEYCGRRVLAAHGDEVNRADRAYLLWKRLTKSRPVYGLFRRLPGSWGIRLGESLERRLSGTNVRHKGAFPMAHCRAWAEALLGDTCDTIVLGHFHQEREIPFARGTVYVLPTWRHHHRYLELRGGEPPRFAGFA